MYLGPNFAGFVKYENKTLNYIKYWFVWFLECNQSSEFIVLQQRVLFLGLSSPFGAIKMLLFSLISIKCLYLYCLSK